MEIRPFRGWRYAGDDGDVSPYIAPPYDILSAEDKRELLSRSPRNIVAADLPHVPPKEVGPDTEYARAAELLAEWKRSGVLIQPDRPALYAYEQTFEWAGRSHSRRALLCGVRATELGEDVIPHEHTFAGPKADRLKLTEHTRTQLSPIFGFYDDVSGVATDALWSAASGDPTVQGELAGVAEKLWVVDDADAVSAVRDALSETPAFIADGHHRYTTALDYARALREAGEIDADHEANFVLFALVERCDPGLLVLPTHRIMRGLRHDLTLATLAEAAPEFEWRPVNVSPDDLRDADAYLGGAGEHAMLFVGAGGDARIATLSDPDAMRRAAPDAIDAWRELDVAILQELIVDRALAEWWTDERFIEYTPDARDVLAACRDGEAQLGAVLRGTPLSAVEEIALAGASMPHKSTYFYPKLATGMILKPLE